MSGAAAAAADDPGAATEAVISGWNLDGNAFAVKLLVCSWNMAGKQETNDLSAWIPPDGEGFDIIAVGTQENKTTMMEYKWTHLSVTTIVKQSRLV